AMDLSENTTKALLETLFTNYYRSLSIGDDDRALQSELFARKLWNLYHERIKGQEKRLEIEKGGYEAMKKRVGNEFLQRNPNYAPLRESLGLPPAATK